MNRYAITGITYTYQRGLCAIDRCLTIQQGGRTIWQGDPGIRTPREIASYVRARLKDLVCDHSPLLDKTLTQQEG